MVSVTVRICDGLRPSVKAVCLISDPTGHVILVPAGLDPGLGQRAAAELLASLPLRVPDAVGVAAEA